MTNKIYLIILAAFSICINQYFGYRGVFPIDSFLDFDSSFYVLSGNHPFKDYWLITGPLVSYIQSLFFIIFGINWFSYVLHASLLNMAFAMFSFYFFSRIGLKNYYCFIYSMGVAILAYPPVGSPFVDHHAVIFSTMALYSLSLGFLYNKKLFWFLTPIFISFSFFSKQIPSSYLAIFFIIVIFIYFFIKRNQDKKGLVYLVFGTLFTLFLITLVFFVNAIPIKNFFVQYIFYPMSLGDERIFRLNIDFNNIINQFKFIYIACIPLLIGKFFLIRIKGKNFLQCEELYISFVLLGSIMIFIYSQLLTKNQILIFFLIPIITAYSHLYILKYFNKKYLIYFILAIFMFSTTKYHIRFNHNKKFMELANADFNLAINASQLDARLSGLKWISPEFINDPQKEINFLIDTKNILSEMQKKRKIIVTNYQFFSSFLNNQFTSPNKFYDNLSVPNKKNKYYKNYKDFFLKKIKIDKINYIYFIGNNMHKSDFFSELTKENKCINVEEFNEFLIEFDISKCEQVI